MNGFRPITVAELEAAAAIRREWFRTRRCEKWENIYPRFSRRNATGGSLCCCINCKPVMSAGGEIGMSTAFRRRLVALVGAAALCVAVPGAAVADSGGEPNDNAKDCKSLPSQSKSHDKKPKKAHKSNNGDRNGKKCGFDKDR
jgi:hypothetical protein